MASDLPITFRSGVSLGPGRCRVVGQIDELMEKGSTDSELYEWSSLSGWRTWSVNWVATGLTLVPGRVLSILVLGVDGIVCAETEGQFALEQLGKRIGDTCQGDLRDIRTIGAHAFACGMGRQVHRRDDHGVWTRYDQGVRQAPDDLSVAGFNAMDGADECHMLAAGFGGEIWQCNNNVWSRLDGATNMVLHGVRVVSRALAYVCGQRGVLLRIRENTCQVIHHDLEEDFWGLEWFKGRLYLATDHALFTLDENDVLKPVDVGAPQFTFGDLHAWDGALWSFGPKHLAWTEDGERWHDITPGKTLEKQK
jgi:hypothetical protein